MITNDLNLKTTITIDNKNVDLEIFSMKNGNFTQIKLNNEVFTKNNSLGAIVSAEKSGDTKITESYRSELIEKLTGYIEFLKGMHMEDHHFSYGYHLPTNRTTDQFSPYFDGEAMLCLIKAAKYLGRDDLVPMILDQEDTFKANSTKASSRALIAQTNI